MVQSSQMQSNAAEETPSISKWSDLFIQAFVFLYSTHGQTGIGKCYERDLGR